MPRKSNKNDADEDSEVSVSKEQQEKESETVSSQESSTSAASSRPKRSARKSVLYNSGDYEVNLPGVKIEEDDEVRNDYYQDSPNKTKRGRPAGSETPKTVKKRKIQLVDDKPEDSRIDIEPHEEIEHHVLDHTDPEVGANEEFITNDESEMSNMLEGEEDDGPPKLKLSHFDDDQVGLDVVGGGDEMHFADNEDYLAGAPTLEINIPLGKRRGRPKKAPDADDNIEKKEKPRMRSQPKMYRVSGDRVVSKSLADRVGQYHIKMFEDEIEMTELGDFYATVISGCLAYLLRKERIIELLTNPEEIALIREGGWMLDKPPRLPPLVSHKACYAFYVDGSKVTSVKDISNDDLKPWSATEAAAGEPVIKPNVRRHPVARVSNRLIPIKGDPRLAELHLTEYSAWLPRLLRLRKKIFYLSREGQIYGNILILYDYTCQGEAPTVVNLPHGNDFLRSIVPTESDESMNSIVGDADNPFEDEIVQGSRGGSYLRVRPSKLGWFHNKKLLLKYLVNDAHLLEDSAALNRRVPFIPPLIETSGVFVFFVPASFVANHIHHTGDGLSPWTVNQTGEASTPRVRSTRRALIQDENGVFTLTREPWQNTGLCMVETLSVLARCPRLRKRVLYVQRNNSIIMGNVCYIYEYVRDGPLPTIVKSTKGRESIERNWSQSRKMKPSTSSASTSVNVMNEDEQFIDVEELAVVEEEEVVGDFQEIHEPQSISETQEIEELDEAMQEDTLANGWDNEFEEDALMQQEHADPYYDTPRVLQTGHIYMTVRHKRIASTFDCVLEWIANTNIVEERGIVNYSKPTHPPIVRNSRAYAFFVAGTAIFPHDINRDDFSPWSHNGTPENPTCYRTKVRKVGVVSDESGSTFHIKDIDYKSCPFHLVFLYSINPRDPRLRKKIYYMMETESRLVVSHALIMYDYNVEGALPRLHGGYLKRFTRRTNKRAPMQMHDVDNDVSDISETEKECPFALPPEMADDGTMYLQLLDMEFWNDRNRQLHFLVNKPNLVEALGCLNNRVPALPPATSGKGGFVFFVDGCEVDSRNLTCDGLVPWSENSVSNPQGGTRRPKSSKQPLGLNREGHLRVWKTPPIGTRHDHIEFQMHVYTATLPRCPRLKKKVIYVLKNGQQIGHSMIIYWFTESGEMPIPINLNSLTPEVSAQRIPAAIREEARRLLMSLPPAEVSKLIAERHGMQINQKTLYYFRRRDMISGEQGQPYTEIKNELMDQFVNHDDWSGNGAQTEEMMLAQNTSNVGREGGEDDKNGLLHVVDEGSIQVAEEIQIGATQSVSTSAVNYSRATVGRHLSLGEQLGIQHLRNTDRHTNPLIEKPMTSTGLVRGSQRMDALWRIAKNSFGTSSDNETCDMLWKMMMEKNEARLFHNVQESFGVEIVTDDIMLAENQMMESQIIDDRVVLQQQRQESGEEIEKGMEEMQEEKVFLRMREDEEVEEEEEEEDDQRHKDPKNIGIEQVIVEEVVDDHLLDGALDEVIVSEEVVTSLDEMVVVQQHEGQQ